MLIKDLKLSLQAFLKVYRWRRNDPLVCAPCDPDKPLGQCRVALVSSAGLVVPGDKPFDEAARGGDYSLRVIPSDTEVRELEEHHRSDTFDHSGIIADPNLCFPLDRLHELAAAGEIGAVAPRHLSLMGSITAPGRLVAQTLPQLVQLLHDDEVDIALLVPV